MEDIIQNKDPGGITGRLWALLVLFFALLAIALCMAQPLMPDTSVYLLHTRTWLESGNRYLDSHDSKGPMMALLSAPAVFVFGAARAAAPLRLGAAALLAWALFRALRRHSIPANAAFNGCMLAAILPFSPMLWGDSLRPENYALALTSLVYVLLLRNKPVSLLIAGALAACCFFLKTLLVIPPLALAGGYFLQQWRASRRFPWRTAILFSCGGLVVLFLVLGLLAATDSLSGWFRQTLAWPAEFRKAGILPRPDLRQATLGKVAQWLYRASDDPSRPWWMPLKVPATLVLSGLWPLAGLAVFMAFMRRKDRRPEQWAALAWLAGALLNLCLEYRRWMYPAISLIPPLFVWMALHTQEPARDRRWSRAACRWSRAAWLWSLLLLIPLVQEAGRLLPGRLRGEPMSPYEALAREMKNLYQPGESLLVLDNNYALHLLLPAPPPPPILSLHAAMVSPAERETLRQRIEAQPPDWLAGKTPAFSSIHFVKETPPPVRVVEESKDLLITGPYALIPSTGKAWVRRRQKE